MVDSQGRFSLFLRDIEQAVIVNLNELIAGLQTSILKEKKAGGRHASTREGERARLTLSAVPPRTIDLT